MYKSGNYVDAIIGLCGTFIETKIKVGKKNIEVNKSSNIYWVFKSRRLQKSTRMENHNDVWGEEGEKLKRT